MRTEIIELKKIIASEGMTLTNGEVFGKEVYLGCNDSLDNWYEITDQEAEEIRKQQEESQGIGEL